MQTNTNVCHWYVTSDLFISLTPQIKHGQGVDLHFAIRINGKTFQSCDPLRLQFNVQLVRVTTLKGPSATFGPPVTFLKSASSVTSCTACETYAYYCSFPLTLLGHPHDDLISFLFRPPFQITRGV